ncbi:heterokaryon incompatibility protein-domain-containing protein [Podospora aff. communis PSN243]|uniref:Heterokaryon incompatibility protein-domain-containing protein n=1 Tax=Podospora aff. communis PSN243 TaxID=3040156 RepID=A0AAV9GT45_9PEZI|nr:heterokaryon incompatibility protein-domain-containing protein [Podospora aff. communis PSN243]
MANPNNIAFSPGRMKLHSFAVEQEERAKAEAERRLRENERVPPQSTLESAVLAKFYQYRRIENPYGSRVLVLEPAAADSLLTGRLETCLAGEMGTYKALSYVWGEPKFTDRIFIDGIRLDITESLGTALRRLRPLPKQQPLRIWIDQICINQKDIMERNQQVRLMHAIYKDARQVLVWLGTDPDEHATKAFQLVGSIRSIFEDNLLCRLARTEGSSFDWIPSEYWKSLRELVNLPWFRRAWIPQEIGTDTEAQVYWGSDKISWESLYNAMRLLETQGWVLKKKHKIITNSVTVLHRRFCDLPLDSPAAQARRSFVYQLCLNSRNIATDPRDYVFSQLGHPSARVEPDNTLIIQPDYDNSIVDVYHEIAIRALTTSSTLMILNAVSVIGKPVPPLHGPGERPLPSWVPRWDAGRFNNVLGFPGVYKAAGPAPSGITKASFEDNFNTLMVEGAIIDKLDNVLTKFTHSHFDLDSSKKSFLLSIWRLCFTGSFSSQPSSSRVREKDICKFTAQGLYQPDHKVSTLRAYLDILAPVARFRYTSSPDASLSPSPVSANAVYHSGIAALEEFFPPNNYFSSKNDPRKLIDTKMAYNVKKSAATWIQAAEDHCVHRCFAVTKEKGYFALVPPTAESGDILCLLTGGETPYVLRPHAQDPGVYSFVGEASEWTCSLFHVVDPLLTKMQASSLQSTVLATGLVLVIITLALASLRFVKGLKKPITIHAEDYLCLAGTITGIASWALLYTTTTTGLDKHTWDVSPDVFTPTILQLQAATTLVSTLSHFLTKTSLLCYFLRTLISTRWIQHLSYILLALITVSYFSHEVVLLSLCVPRRSEAWDVDVLLPRCSQSDKSDVAMGVVSVVVNMGMFCIPLPKVRDIITDREEGKGKKWALLGVVGGGLMVVVTSVVGLGYRVIVVRGGDVVWNGVNVGITSYVEILGTIMVSCGPAVYAGWPSVLEGVTAAAKKGRALVEKGKEVAEKGKTLAGRVRVVERAKTVTEKTRAVAGRARFTWKVPRVLPHRRGRRDTEPVYSYPRQAPANGRLTMTASSDQKLANLIIPLFSEEAAGATSQPGTSGPRLTGLGASGNVL